MKITTLTDRFGIEQITIDNGDGSFTTMPKSVYDTLVSDSSTLASELSNPSTPQAGE